MPSDFPATYLQYYGYLKEGVPLEDAVKEFQSVVGLEPDGDLSAQTLRMMLAPRCGLPDYPMMAEEARWRKNRLRYWVEKYVEGLGRSDQDDLMALAWKDWEAAADLKFERVNTRAEADIVISAGQGRGDGFDGPSGTLAWAELPPGNDKPLLMRFDLAEKWIKQATEPGILYRNVACHEFGHLIGLDHSRMRGALMAPYYAPGIVSPVANDDVSRARALYGPPQPPDIPAPTQTKVVIEVGGPVVALEVPGWRCTKMAG